MSTTNGVSNAAKVKGLRTQLQKMTGDAEAMIAEIKVKQKEHGAKVTAIARIKHEIEACEAVHDLVVSEHAILRYMERVMGTDTEAIRDQILSPQVRDLVGKLGGSGSYPANGFQVVMRNGTVVTIKN